MNTEQALVMAVARIKDLLMQDDGQAYKEAEKFLDQLKKTELLQPVVKDWDDMTWEEREDFIDRTSKPYLTC